MASLYVFGPEGYPVLETALTALDRAHQARAVLAREGLTFTTKKTGTVHAHPMLRVERDALREFRLTWAQLDLDISPPGEALT